ncbi:hypothetical protein AAVH_14242 [Aphelenchoides avenae]|nr:hypothetical protein AAVH_14242 [Aphelenchus avenae]
MYTAYCQSNLSACVQVSTKFNPDCARLSVKVVQEYLKRSVTRQRVIHQTCGQLIRLEKDGPLVLPLIAPSHSMNVFGRKLARSDGCTTPETDRRRKLEARNTLLGSFDEEDDELEDCEPAAIWDGAKNDYPSWPDQITGIERRADALMLVENDEAGLKLMKEVEDLWLVWNSDYRLAFDDRQKQALETSKQ